VAALLKRLLIPLFLNAVVSAAAANSEAAKATAAADAFLRTLSSGQRGKVVYPFSSSAMKTGWSNLPTTFVKRAGVPITDLRSAHTATRRRRPSAWPTST
jgi:hypothetical protein